MKERGKGLKEVKGYVFLLVICLCSLILSVIYLLFSLAFILDFALFKMTVLVDCCWWAHASALVNVIGPF